MTTTSSPPQTDSSKPLADSLKSKSTLRLAKSWNVSTNPPSNSTKGHLVPNFLTRTRRCLSVEVYRFEDSNGSHYDECYIRVLEPASKEQKKSLKKLTQDIRRRRGKAHVNDSANLDDNSSLLDGSSLLECDNRDLDMPEYDGWKVKYKLPLSAVHLLGVNKRVVSFDFAYHSINQNRQIFFDTEEDALDCNNFIESQKVQEEQRQLQKFALNSRGFNVTPTENISLLVEIVGATGLIPGDTETSDPYVMCYFNHQLVHRTKHIPKTLDPIWTIKTNGLFMLEMTMKELFQGEGLHLDVMDFDTVGKNETLGSTQIGPREMYTCNGTRTKLPLEGVNAKGVLSIRVRIATPSDINFMKEYEMSNKKKPYALSDVAMKAALSKKGGVNTIQSVLSRNVKTEKVGTEYIKKYRVRPGPDPKRVEETTWMTLDQMEKEMFEESRQWIDAGSGTLGRLFVEVLSCNGLPNLDTGGFTGNYTDAFACLVFEDVWGQTDIIDDDLNPKWMPWTKRAFIFHMYHSSSQLFIGVFDNDAVDNHDLIGRIAINISNLQPDTLYTLTYDLYPSGKWSIRDPRGQITIRLRFDIDDDRKLLLSALEPPKTIYVNVMDKKNFNVLHGACNGAYDMETYSWSTLFVYLDELQSYQGCLLYVKQALITLIFWRGHYKLVIGGKTFLLPLHSMTAFSFGVLLLEYPQLLPSFYFFSIAWLLVASMMFRRHHPSAWHRCKSFIDIFVAVVWGDSFPPAQIDPNQDAQAVLDYESMWQAKVDNEARLAAEAQLEAEDDAEEAERAADVIGDTDTDISTKRRSKFMPVSVDLLKPFLEPLQAYLAIACRLLRYVRNVVMWEECYMAFWLTLGCLVLAVVSLFIPWFFLIKWTSRILVWTALGPWMRVVDIFYYTPMENMTEEEHVKRKEAAKMLREKLLAEAIEKARIDRERARKLKEMKKFMFGKFIMKVPILKEDRWQDFPRPESSAVPYNPKPLALAELAMNEAGYHRIRVPGQHLEGDMIPSLQMHSFTDAPVGQATKKHAQSETDTAAYAKMGSLVAGAAVITYYGIPAASSIFSSLFGN